MIAIPKRQDYSASYKKKELTGDDPYSMKGAPKGFLQCSECQDVYYRKPWSLPGSSSSRSSQAAGAGPKKPTRQVMGSQSFKGKITYQWSHKDKLARVEWQGPKPPTLPRQKPKTSQTKK